MAASKDTIKVRSDPGRGMCAREHSQKHAVVSVLASQALLTQAERLKRGSCSCVRHGAAQPGHGEIGKRK